MIESIAIAAVALIAIVLILAATRPDTFEIRREASIAARPEDVFPLIQDFRRWVAWSPWEKLDPALRRTYSGAPAGTGAVYAWEGNGKVGAGRMEIAEATAPSRIRIRLDFIRPCNAQNDAEFTLERRGGTTLIAWAMRGRCSFVAKVMSLFISFDRMIGRSFESGLAALKSLAETAGADAPRRAAG